MKSVRLLPVVIFAAVALLLFKGIGLVANGSYVLTGTEAAVAATGGSADHGATASADIAAPEPVTMEDEAPTLTDPSPTLGASDDGGRGAPAADGDGEPAAEEHSAPSGDARGAPAEHEASAEARHDTSSSAEAVATTAVIPTITCPPSPGSVPEADGGHGAAAPVEAAPVDCVPIPVDEHGDALPATKDMAGNLIPLSELSGGNAEQAVLTRLGERRAELDKLAADLDTRMALVEAAEKRIEEKSTQLRELEAQINALVDQKKAAEDEQFKAVVSMYESMKPRDAATIFNALDLNVLLRVARSMSPRKMAPILAGMDPERAKNLTSVMAADLPPATVADAGENLANLPQIVGQ